MKWDASLVLIFASGLAGAKELSEPSFVLINGDELEIRGFAFVELIKLPSEANGQKLLAH